MQAEGLIKFDGLDSAIIGVASAWDSTGAKFERLVYSGDLIVREFMRDGMGRDEAIEFIGYNTEGSYLGPNTPIVVWPYDPDDHRDAGARAMMTATIGLPPRELAQNVSAHYMARARATKRHRWESFVAWRVAMMKHGNWKPVPIALSIEYTHHRLAEGYQPTDQGNAIGALKAAIDGIVDAGVIPDDTSKWLRIGECKIVRTKGKGAVAGVKMTVVPQ